MSVSSRRKRTALPVRINDDETVQRNYFGTASTWSSGPKPGPRSGPKPKPGPVTKEIETVLFDLDNTLYDERMFITGAFTEVAVFLAERTNLDAKALLDELLLVEQRDGRSAVFDTVLANRSLDPKWAKPMLHIYRTAIPFLSFFSDAAPLLASLARARIRTAVVTDGYGLVQANKAKALHLDTHVDAVVYTDSLGSTSAKTSIDGLEAALAMIGGTRTSSAYVTNNVNKDFIGPKDLGMSSVLVRRKMIGDREIPPASNQPDQVVGTLASIPKVLTFKSRLD